MSEENSLDDAITNLMGSERMKAEEIEAAATAEEAEAEPEGSSILSDEEIAASQGSKVVPDFEDPGLGKEPVAEAAEAAAEPAAADAELPVEDDTVAVDPDVISITEYQRMKRETFATQSELKRIRELRRADTERIRNLETITEDVSSQLRESKVPEIPQEVLDDPLYRSIDERIAGLESKVNPAPVETQPGQITQHQANLAARYLRESGEEMRRAMPEGHFDSAYAHARKVYMEKNNIPDGVAMNQVEIRMAIELGAQGRSPAIESVRFAEANDWQPPVNGVEVVDTEKSGIPEVSDTRVRRLRHGVDGNSASSTGASPQGRTGAMSTTKFYSTFDAGERMAIFQRHPDAFDHLAEHNEVPAEYLPS